MPALFENVREKLLRPERDWKLAAAITLAGLLIIAAWFAISWRSKVIFHDIEQQQKSRQL